jgi:cardiolipin synthase (CMP-forming)
MWSNLPNLLTIGRILLVPVTVWSLLGGDYLIALLAFVIAGVTDGLDGYLARRFSWQSVLGSYLDPLADKALLVSTYVTLAILHALPQWLAILVVSRDVMIVGAVLLSRYLEKPVVIKPVFVSKANTVAQIAFVVVLLASLALGWSIDRVLLAGAFSVAVLTLGSLAVYMRIWLSHMAVNDSGKSP